MPEFTLSPIDWVIVVGYFLFIIWRGFSYVKQHEDAEEYFLAGRSLAWPLIGLSLYASNMSSSSLVGMAGSGYETGFSVFSYEWMAAIVLIIFAVFFLPYYLRARVYTMPEFLEKRYDNRSRYFFSGINVLANIIIDTAATLYAGALVINQLFPSVEFWQSILALTILSGLYTIAGGLTAVVYTDTIQAILLIIGSIIVTILAFLKIGSWEAVLEVTPKEHFSIVQPIDDPFLPWPGLISGVFLLGFYFWTNNQFIAQRALAAKDIKHGQWGSVFCGFLKITTPLFIMIIPGTMARVLYPNLENADLVYPTLLFDLLPVGILGLVIAGLIAAMMSSIDSALNSASTLVTMDFFSTLRPQTSSEGLMWVGRIVTGIFMILAAGWAYIVISQSEAILWDYLQSALSYIAPPIAALFIMGIFWKRGNGHGAVGALIAGVVTDAYFLIARSVDGLPVVHYLYMAGIIFVVCCLTLVVVSLLTAPPPPEKVNNLTWSRKIYDDETRELKAAPIYQNYRIHSIIILVLLGIILAIFW